MKKLFFLSFLFPALMFAQAPDLMSYQTVVWDTGNNLVTNSNVGFQMSILQGSVAGPSVFVETHTVMTNANGLATFQIGAGTLVSGSFTTIDWSNGPYFLKTEADPTGGTTYSITGTSQLVSVPYALYANVADSVVNDPDPDPMNELNTGANLVGSDLNITDAGGTITVDLSPISAGTGFYVGMQYGGGIIIFVDSSGQHGLIAAPADVASAVLFEAAPNELTVFAPSYWDGANNTDILVNGAGSAHGFTAAIAADSYAGGGYNDWYLPAAFELEIMLNANLPLIYSNAQVNLGEFYWSSTEDPSAGGFNALRGRNNTLFIETTSEANTANVRPIRAF